jgi:hypothetical protein
VKSSSSFGHLGDVVRRNGPAAGSRFITTLLETGLEMERLKEQEERAAAGKTVNPYFTMVEKCVRQSYFTLTEEPVSNPLDVNSLTNFKVGHAIEEAFSSIISWASGGPPAREIPLEFDVEGVRVSGRLDFVIPLLGERILIELKATNRFAIGAMLKHGEQGRFEHRSQINLYLHASHTDSWPCSACEGRGHHKLYEEGRFYSDLPCSECDAKGRRPEPFDLAYLVYIIQGATKGEPVCHAFPIQYSKQKAESDLLFLSQLQKMADEGADPGVPQGYTKSKYPCSYCSYKDRCWTPGFGEGRVRGSASDSSPDISSERVAS